MLALAFAGRLPHGEIAEILGVPVGTVKSRVHHARAALARTLADRGGADRAPVSGEELGLTAEDVRHCTDALASTRGAQPRPARAPVEAHLAGCPPCRAELASWTTVAAATVGRRRRRRIRRGRSGQR